MSGSSLPRATSSCVRPGRRSYVITLTVCGSMLTSVAFDRKYILFVFDRPVLSGPDIQSACFDLTHLRIAPNNDLCFWPSVIAE